MTRTWLVLPLVTGCALAGNSPEPRVDGSVDRVDGAVVPHDVPMQVSPCAMTLAGKAIDFEASSAGWTHVVLDNASAPGWPLDEWQYGTATTGPGSCHGGTKCWATRLDANYTSCSRAALISPTIDLSTCATESVKLGFWSWHDFWTGTVSGKPDTWFDGGIVEVSTDGSTWLQVTPSPAYPGTVKINPNIGTSYSCVSANSFQLNGKPGLVGNGGGWQQVNVTLPASVLTTSFQVRFSYSSGVSFSSTDAEVDRMHTRPGWYIDDLSFTAM